MEFKDYNNKQSSENNNQIAIDFDGVIHKNSKGFFDGTVYDDPVDGVEILLERLSKRYTLVLFSAKARSDRMLINGKTGIELIEEWLIEKKLIHYFSEITAEKPSILAPPLRAAI